MKRTYREGRAFSTGETREIELPRGWACRSENGALSVQMPLPDALLLLDTRDIVEQYAAQTGLLIAREILNREVESLAGPRYARGGGDVPVRWGRDGGYIVFAGRKVPIERPRLRRGRSEVPLESYRLLQSDGKMQRAVKDRIVLGISTRDYEGAIEGFAEGYGIKRSSVSRQFVAASAKKLEELCNRSLEGLGLAALVVDGIEVGGQSVVVAVGVDECGGKHVLGLWEGATENAAVCEGLFEDLERRGLEMGRRYLFVIDGSRALWKAIVKRFGSNAEIQRCQVHKKRNVMEHLPEGLRWQARMRMNAAYGMESYEEAKEALKDTVRWLRRHSEGAARSLEEGMEETLTLHRLGVREVLRRSLNSTNIIESVFGNVRRMTGNVKRWRGVDMVRRWVGTMLLEAERKFRRIRGHKYMPELVEALRSGKVIARRAVGG